MVLLTGILCRRLQRTLDAIAVSLQRPVSETYVVKRVHEPGLTSSNRVPSLRRRHFVYEPLPDPHATPKQIPVFLTEYVPDLGRPGEVVTLEDSIARRLIVCKSGMYATPENLESVHVKLSPDAYSTKYVGTTISLLSATVLKIPMNTEEPWTLQRWHVRTALRLAGIHVPEDAIKLPEGEEDAIRGPIKGKEMKEFQVEITINKKEAISVRCQIVQPLHDDD